jgi:hypothetical protein
MPQSNSKQYGGKAPLVGSAGQKEAITPVTPIRSGLRIQNTGANNLRVMFGRPTTNAGDDYIINPGTTASFRDPCPVESIYLSCNAITTYCILEENEPDQQTRGRVNEYLRDR